jgi:hypothetical protein
MSFINEIFKISLFLPEGVKIDIENIKRASNVCLVTIGVSMSSGLECVPSRHQGDDGEFVC